MRTHFDRQTVLRATDDLVERLARGGVAITKDLALEGAAAFLGARNWPTLCAALPKGGSKGVKDRGGPAEPRSAPADTGHLDDVETAMVRPGPDLVVNRPNGRTLTERSYFRPDWEDAHDRRILVRLEEDGVGEVLVLEGRNRIVARERVVRGWDEALFLAAVFARLHLGLAPGRPPAPGAFKAEDFLYRTEPRTVVRPHRTPFRLHPGQFVTEELPTVEWQAFHIGDCRPESRRIEVSYAEKTGAGEASVVEGFGTDRRVVATRAVQRGADGAEEAVVHLARAHLDGCPAREAGLFEGERHAARKLRESLFDVEDCGGRTAWVRRDEREPGLRWVLVSAETRDHRIDGVRGHPVRVTRENAEGGFYRTKAPDVGHAIDLFYHAALPVPQGRERRGLPIDELL